jgi:hypothetical protein
MRLGLVITAAATVAPAAMFAARFRLNAKTADSVHQKATGTSLIG